MDQYTYRVLRDVSSGRIGSKDVSFVEGCRLCIVLCFVLLRLPALPFLILQPKARFKVQTYASGLFRRFNDAAPVLSSLYIIVRMTDHGHSHCMYNTYCMYLVRTVYARTGLLLYRTGTTQVHGGNRMIGLFDSSRSL